MLVGLLVLLLFAVLQVAVYCYARTVVDAAVADGAHAAAVAGAPLSAGQLRSQRLVSDGLGSQLGKRIECVGSRDLDPKTGLSVTTLRCRGYVHALFLPLTVPLAIDVESSVLTEPPA